MNLDVFEYALVRAVPCLERGEFVNIGLLVYSRSREFLGVRTLVDEARLRALCDTVDTGAVRDAVGALERVCVGGPDAGPSGADSAGSRFRWLTAPRSTLVQPGPVHTGLTADPFGELDRLFAKLVAVSRT